MNLPRSIGGWLLLFSPAGLIIAGMMLPGIFRSLGWTWAISPGSYGLEFAIYALFLSVPLSLALGIWISPRDRGWPIRVGIGILAGASLIAANCGIAFAGCMTLSGVGLLK